MATPVHTADINCHLYDPPEKPTYFDPRQTAPDPPRLRAQFFYLSPLSIDDPLTAVSTPSGPLDASKLPPRPFSVRDNVSLEDEWTCIRRPTGDVNGNPAQFDNQLHRLRRLAFQDKKYPIGISESKQPARGPATPTKSSVYQSFAAGFDGDEPFNGITSSRRFRDVESDSSPVRAETGEPTSSAAGEIGSHRKRQGTIVDRSSKSSKWNRSSSPGGDADVSGEGSGCSTPQIVRPAEDTNISGSPFIRAPARDPEARHSAPTVGTNKDSKDPNGKRPVRDATAAANKKQPGSTVATPRSDRPESTITVGASRLHLVEFPQLQMKPIYWSPVHDISAVIRATWFYKNTMLPLDPELANEIETGYMDLKPWSETWQDELNSCVNNGAEAETKIAYKLWADEDDPAASRPGSGEASGAATAANIKKPHEEHNFEENMAAGGVTPAEPPSKLYKNASVIYVDSKNAQILRPSLLPSSSSGRRPLSSIRKGRQIGIAIVRGFDRRVWEKLHPTKLSAANLKNFMKIQQQAARQPSNMPQMCHACQMESRKPVVSDLIFVIHGIGQKLSERVESFHFTHAINAFRRDISAELSSNAVWPNMRNDLENVMVLPINWRSTLSLEDTDVEEAIENEQAQNRFVLRDITPESIPAVRNLISDVMLDVPYYLSHHKEKMTRAVIKEANRIYRIWCGNNPGFQKNGRVHIIAHSLGSVMAMDILSQQPTKLRPINFTNSRVNEKMFEFETKNLFFCGSPAGFFLLLHKACLHPRRHRRKPDSDHHDDFDPTITREAGTYGCLAVENIYNILHDTDPIAYRLNAAVDTDLARALKPASVPTSSTSFFQTLAGVFRWSSRPEPAVINIPPPQRASSSTTVPPRRPGLLSNLPSNVEMETHDFTREETAERKMLLLNDNGQIDYTLSGGSGPLNIQYLNMLSAHSSYWILQDFVRFIVVEIGRKPGKNSTLLPLRAEKKKGWKRW